MTSHLYLQQFTGEVRWLSLKEITEYFGAYRETIYKWIEGKGMPGHRAGRRKVARMPANTSGEDPATRRTAES